MVTFLIVGPEHLLRMVATSFAGNVFYLQRQVERSAWGRDEDVDPDRLGDKTIDIVVFDPKDFGPAEIAKVEKACNGKLVAVEKGRIRSAIQAKLQEIEATKAAEELQTAQK